MKILDWTPDIRGLHFTKTEIKDAQKNNQPLLITLYTKAICNVKCPSCFISNVDSHYNELSLNDYKDIIIQAHKNGIKSIKISGAGEPLIVPEIIDIIKTCHQYNITTVIYTNGTSLGDDALCFKIFKMSSLDLIQFLKKHDVSIVYKFNSMNAKTQDYLLGMENYAQKTYQGLFNLLYSNYNKDNRLALQTIITPYNYDETPTLYRFARENHIIPYFETVLKKEKAVEHQDLYICDDEINEIFMKLCEIDKKEFSIGWFPVPSYVNFMCTELMYGFLIDNFGYARVCPGIWESVGNIQEENFESLWNKELLYTLRHKMDQKLTGTCKTCNFREDETCTYGCRAYAYLNADNLFGSYNECWWNR